MKTISARILSELGKQQKKGKALEINRKVLNRVFKKDMFFSEDLNDTYMRQCRTMVNQGILTRVSRGIYTASSRTEKTL